MKMRITDTAMQILRDVKKACESYEELCQDSDGDVCIFYDAGKGCILKNRPEEWKI